MLARFCETFSLFNYKLRLILLCVLYGFLCHSIKNLLHCKSMFCVSSRCGTAYRAAYTVLLGVNDNKYPAQLMKHRQNRAF
jgi:hypothetical protein